MKYFFIIILTFISCNLIAEENPILQIDKDTFCKEVIQEKNDCYRMKNYIDNFLREEWYAIYTSSGEKHGYSVSSEYIETSNGKNYFIFSTKDIYIGKYEEKYGEETNYVKEVYQAFYPFKLIKSELAAFNSDGYSLEYIGELIGSDFIITKKLNNEESQKTIKEFNFELLTTYSFLSLFDKDPQVGDEYTIPSYDLLSLYEDNNLSMQLQFKINAIENKIIDDQSSKIFTIDMFDIDENGGTKFYGQYDTDEEFYIHEIRLRKDIYDGTYTLAPKEIARQIHYGNQIYVGDHQGGVPHGLGKLTDTDNDFVYEGEYVNGKMQGKGFFTHKGKRYEGEFFEDKPSGYGVLEFSDGEKYEGEFLNGMAHGTGTYYWAESGNRYEGEWIEHKKHGLGTLFYPDGTKQEGQWKNNEFVN